MERAWGPLQPLLMRLAAEDRQPDGERDRKQQDLALSRELGAEDSTRALQAASRDQLDLALAHDALAVDRKPFCHLLLLATKGGKLERLNVTADQQRAISAGFVAQMAQFLHQVPIYVASKELTKVTRLCAQYATHAIALQQSLKTIFPLKSFLRRFHQHGNMVVTPIHGQFLYLCLHAKCYSAAMEILDLPLFEVDDHKNLMTSADFLAYAYYGGVLYLGEKRYQDAIDFFMMAVTAPAGMLSAFVVAAFKKLVLTSLIVHGLPPSLPSHTSFAVSRNLETRCEPYLKLGKAFLKEATPESLAQVVAEHASAFVKDGNMGLVKQAVEAHMHKKLLELPNTYVMMPLSEIATAIGLAEGGDVAAEKMLLKLVAQGELGAVMDKQQGMVRFVLNEDASEAVVMSPEIQPQQQQQEQYAMAKLEHEMQQVLRVSAKLRALDTEIVTQPKFQRRNVPPKDKDRRARGTHGDDDRMLETHMMDLME